MQHIRHTKNSRVEVQSTRKNTCATSRGTCGPTRAGTEGRKMPHFSVAISAVVRPSRPVWSSCTDVTTDRAVRTELVASSRPPMPTSSTATSHRCSLNSRQPKAVTNSKKVDFRSLRSETSNKADRCLWKHNFAVIRHRSGGRDGVMRPYRHIGLGDRLAVDLNPLSERGYVRRGKQPHPQPAPAQSVRHLHRHASLLSARHISV